jgi:hypothetical protein
MKQNKIKFHGWKSKKNLRTCESTWINNWKIIIERWKEKQKIWTCLNWHIFMSQEFCTISQVDMNLMCSNPKGNFCPPIPLHIHVYIMTTIVFHFPIYTSAIIEDTPQWHFQGNHFVSSNQTETNKARCNQDKVNNLITLISCQNWNK